MLCLPFRHVVGGIFQTANNSSELVIVNKHKLLTVNLQRTCCSHKNVTLNEKLSLGPDTLAINGRLTFVLLWQRQWRWQ